MATLRNTCSSRPNVFILVPENMHFPKFWAKGVWRGHDEEGNAITRDAWGWSDASESDARAKGEERARALAAAWRPGAPPPERSAYGYPDRPLREPVLRTIAADGATALITRNSYGCEVLNTDRALFIDVALPPPEQPGLFARLFGGAKPRPDPYAPLVDTKLAQLQQWQHGHPDLGFRVYRTAGGLRYLLVSMAVRPSDEIVGDALAQLDADPNYRRLCGTQKTFRARLTPKHWRCGLRKPPERFPFANAKQSERFVNWLSRYDDVCRQHAVCRFIRTIGTARASDALSPILTEHDRATGVATSLPLA